MNIPLHLFEHLVSIFVEYNTNGYVQLLFSTHLAGDGVGEGVRGGAHLACVSAEASPRHSRQETAQFEIFIVGSRVQPRLSNPSHLLPQLNILTSSLNILLLKHTLPPKSVLLQSHLLAPFECLVSVCVQQRTKLILTIGSVKARRKGLIEHDCNQPAPYR